MLIKEQQFGDGGERKRRRIFMERNTHRKESYKIILERETE